MVTVNLQHNLQGLLKDVETDRKAIAKSASRAINTTARGVITDAVRELKQRYPKLKAGEIRDLMRIVQFASENNLRAVVQARGRPLGLMRFVAGKPDLKKGGGVRVAIKGGSKMISHAFIAKGRDFGGSRSDVVFIRKDVNNPKSPIMALRTINIPDAMNIGEVRTILNKMIEARFDKEFARQIVLLSGPKR